jgi:putative copper resistance protein D
VAVLAAAALGLASHTGTSADHETSVNAMAVHIVAAGTWFGGLIALVGLRRAAALTQAAVSRWSTVALWCFCAVAVSGIIAATTRLGPWADLATPYGRLLVVKAVGLLLLGWAGWAHRRSTIRRLERSSRGFWRLVLGELAVMAATVGAATALSRSAPPVPEEVLDPSPTLALTGYPAPPPPDAWSWLTTWRIDWLLLAVAVVAIGTYAAGLVLLRRSLRAWPASRTAAWVVGWVVFVVATSAGPGTYGRVALSWHVALILVELLVVPAFLVVAEPISLARGVARLRPAGTLGVLIEPATSSRGSRARSTSAAGLLGNPLVVVGVAVIAVIALVLGPGLGWTLETHPGHVIVSLALPLLGSAVVGSIRAAHRDGERTQTTAAIAALAGALALLGIALVLGSRPLAEEFFETLQLPWLTDLIAEQRRSGLVVWAIGALGLAGVLMNLATPRVQRVR